MMIVKNPSYQPPQYDNRSKNEQIKENENKK